MLIALIFLAGCSSSSTSHTGTNPPTSASATLNGKVLGGQQPVQGAEIQLFVAGSTGYGAGAKLLTPAVFTDQNGAFSISASYTCPSASAFTYLIATGGDPGIGVDNPALTLMVSLGACESLATAPSIVVNEVTTVASAWALAPFLGAGGEVGTSSTNSQGLLNAYITLSNLVDFASGTAPGASAPEPASVPVSKIYTLANILAACVNSSGSGVCDTLFGAAQSLSGASPTNTLDAAINIARNPSSNVSTLFDIPTPTSPFQPSLTTAPSDWTLSMTYEENGLCTYNQSQVGCEPGSISIDAEGNVWVANYLNSVMEFSNTGQPLSPTGGVTGGSLNESYGIAINETGSVWITNEVTPGINEGHGSVTVLSSSGTVTSGSSGYFGGGVYFPVAVAGDTDGSIWTANYGNSTASKLSSTGSAISGSSGYGSSQLVGPVAVAIDTNHNAWFANQSAPSGSVTSISSDGNTVTTTASGGDGTSGVATDSVGVSGGLSKGHVWTANYYSSTVSELELKNNGTVAVISSGYTGGGLNHPNGIAIDGAGNVWLANYDGDTITELQGAGGITPGSAISSSSGFGKDAKLSEPYGIAIDSSGNVWVSNLGSSTITQFVGAATPVKTPLLGPAQLP